MRIPYLDTALEILAFDQFRINNILPSEWAEKYRIMSSEVSPIPGPFSFKRTPYIKEIVDTLTPESPAKFVVVMKGAQIGFSTGMIENGIGWIIKENPGPIFFTTGAQDLSDQAINIKVDQMIDSCGLRDLIRPNTLRKKNARTGDTTSSKEFPGGRLQTGVTSQHNKIRQVSMQYGFMDDWETAPNSTEKDGATLELIDQRFAAYWDKMKLYFISTPQVKQTSNIEPLYLLGDQRRYFIPCPCCGDMIFLEWSIRKEDEKFGIYYELDNKGKLIDKSVGYRCQSCGEVFDDKDKLELNLAGEWKPTATAKDPDYLSYHLSALYAPPGMKDWRAYVKQYLKACPPNGDIDPAKLKTFYNLCLGWTFEERGASPNVKHLAKNTRNYEPGIVPYDLAKKDRNGEIVMITCACDLNGFEDDARLDYEITAWTENQCSYSIIHGSIGTFIPTALRKKEDEDKRREKWTYEHDHPLSVWPKFLEVISKAYQTDDNREVFVNITGVDTGHYTTYANEFISRIAKRNKHKQEHERALPIVGLKGHGKEKYRPLDKDSRIFWQSLEQKSLWMVDVNKIKDNIAVLIKKRWDGSQDQDHGFMNFPTPNAGLYTMKGYFSHFESEHKIMQNDKTTGKPKGMLWTKRNTRLQNHFWDCRIYGEALRHIFGYNLLLSKGQRKYSWDLFCETVLNN